MDVLPLVLDVFPLALEVLPLISEVLPLLLYVLEVLPLGFDVLVLEMLLDLGCYIIGDVSILGVSLLEILPLVLRYYFYWENGSHFKRNSE